MEWGEKTKLGGGADTLADPYKGKIPLARVHAFLEPSASRHVIQQDNPNIRRATNVWSAQKLS